MRLFLDTNAIIDLFSNAGTSRQKSMRELVSALRNTDSTFILGATTIKDVSYLIECGAWFKSIVPDASRRKKLAYEAREFMFKQCEMCAVDQTICHQAHMNRDEPDFDDAIIAECARTARADFIISSDVAAFNKSVIKKMSPEECIKYLEINRE